MKEAQKARRLWTKLHSEESWVEYQKATSKKKSQIKKAKMLGWRAIVSETTNDPAKLWKLTKWAKKRPNERSRLLQLPDIKDKDGNLFTEDTDKADILARHFFPQPIQANLEDIEGTVYPEEMTTISSTITETEIQETMAKLASETAPGLDGIPNWMLKNCRLTLSKYLGKLFNACTSNGYHSKGFKESATIVLRKPQKEPYDNPKSYRPIALLTTIRKLLEKLIANRISKAAEDHHLPDEQMGARQLRSTVTAVELLTEQVHTIWVKNKRVVASLLSLDIFEAFDNVSHERLIHNMRVKGTPRWITLYVESFLKDRTTTLNLGSFKGDKFSTNTGIPQGSSLSPILFLFFVSTLLPELQSPSSTAVEFVDDTNILTWSDSTEENCRNLERLHGVCEKWAEQHGVKFAPEKYQLMHFSRARKRHNVQATLHIQGYLAKPQTSLRVLGIHLDPKLNWGAHIKIIQLKVEPQIQALGRLAQSTWGATFHKAKLVYNAVVRPAVTYGSPIWAEPGIAGKIPERVIKPLRSIQRRCLKIVTGAYNSTSSKVLDHETSTLPKEIYLKQRRVQHAGILKSLPVRDTISWACRKIKQSKAGRKDARIRTRIHYLAQWGQTCADYRLVYVWTKGIK